MELEVDFANLDINSSYAYSKLRNKSKIPDAAEENNLALTQASNNFLYDEAATPLNLHSPLGDSSELIPLVMPVRTLLQCNAISTTYETTS